MTRIYRWLDDHIEQYQVRLTLDLLASFRGRLILAGLLGFVSALIDGMTVGIIPMVLQMLMGGTAADIATILESVPVLSRIDISYMSDEQLLVSLVGLAVAGQILNNGLLFAGNAIGAYVRSHVERLTMKRVFEQLMTLSYGQLMTYKLGDLTDYKKDTIVVGLITERFVAMMQSALMIMVYVFAMFLLSWQMTLAAIVILILLSLSLSKLMRHVRAMAREFIRTGVEVNEHITEYLNGIRVVRSFARESYVIQKVNEILKESSTARRKGLTWEASIQPINRSAVILIVVALLGALYLLSGGDEVTNSFRFITLLFILYRLMTPTATINSNIGKLNAIWPSLERVAGILRTDDKSYVEHGGGAFTGLKDSISFQNVSIQYLEDERKAVDGLDFYIERGMMVALVGESGAGKSTIVDLVLRLYDPTDGQILVDREDIRELDLQDWRTHIGVVNQDTFLFHDTIRENIVFARPSATDEEIVAAAKAAYAHPFIEEMAHGYETIIGDRGYRLSGGQRQRIALARAILRNPDLLILDEATSDLDSQSEEHIREAIESIRDDLTILMVAHRLSTVATADLILVLENGKVIERGTHRELLKHEGAYYKLWQIQTEPELKPHL